MRQESGGLVESISARLVGRLSWGMGQSFVIQEDKTHLRLRAQKFDLALWHAE
jgi:hypothetical protein